jgi:outer membrane protein assembly factor BamB
MLAPLRAALVASIVLPCAAQEAARPLAEPSVPWPSWRGPNGTGHVEGAKPPTSWSETENLRFKLELPGQGYGTPVVAGGLAFFAAARPIGDEVEPVPDDMPGAHDNARIARRHEFLAFAVDLETGEIAWQSVLHQQLPHAVFHKSSALVTASAVTDGEHVIFSFGSYGLFCLTMDGERVWDRDLGDLRVKHGHGEGGSPVLYGDTVVVNWDHEGPSFVVALDKNTGEELWKKDRDEPTSWSTPITVEHDGRIQVVVSATNAVRAYDLATGDVLWSCSGLSHNVVASPVSADGVVYAGSSYEKRRMFAVALDGAKGDVTDSDHVLWRRQRGTPYVPSPLLCGEWLYFMNHYQGFLARVHAKTGAEPRRPVRLPGMREIYASPVAAGGHLYVTDRTGVTAVLRDDHERGLILVARNVLEDRISASAAIVGDEILLRGERFLYCIARADDEDDSRGG